MLRLLLPPNLAAAAPRDAIAVKVEIDPLPAPPPELLPALALLQRWCGPAAKPPFLLQLSRAQLRELIGVLLRQPVFFFASAPAKALLWVGPLLAGVSEHLREAAAAPPPAPAAAGIRGVSPPTRRVASDSPPAPMVVDGTEHFLAITLPSREHPAYEPALELLKQNGFTLEPSNRKWWLRDRHKTLNFLAAHRARLRDRLDAQFTEAFEGRTAHLHPAEVAVSAAAAGDGFEVTLGLRAGNADDAAMRAALAGNRGYIEVDGKVFLLDQAQLNDLAEAQAAIAGDPHGGVSTRRSHRVSAARAAEVQEIIESVSPDFQPPDTWRERSAGLRQLEKLVPAPLEDALHAQLRPYQRLGVAWLWHLHRHGLGGVLADEMGLGKTLQALALLSAHGAPEAPLKEEGAKSKDPIRADSAPRTFNRSPSVFNSTSSLVVCPASLLENWRREAARFTPRLRVFVHHGAQRLGPAEVSAFDLVITSYGTLARDREMFSAIPFRSIVADEAQHIKNRRSQNAAALRSLRAESRFLLTGTPLENSLEDLRSLFEFLLPGCVTPVPAGIRGDERQWFDQRLRAQVAPYILRRTKAAVAPELPPKLEQIVWCELTPAQGALYRQQQESSERELIDLAASGANEGRLQLAALTQLLRLRQVCCDPRLVERSAGTLPASAGEAAPYAHSAKLDAFRELLAEAIDDGHRVLVFSQFTSLLALLCVELEGQQTPYCYLDGSMSPKARQAEVDRFQEGAEIPVFLISLKAGGTGLNLTGADTVIHFDPWWNPAAEAQATDRAHRIGQLKTVTSYKLIASGTVEEKVLALQDTKRALLAEVFEASDAAAAKLSLADLQALLRP
ncbi:MAG: Non-specific serine/threonine protein kinase [Verrucomicrobia bacterium]|nr:Non-specific serine/threonine protein kinase [Verrucomicrobiota bacterium]